MSFPSDNFGRSVSFAWQRSPFAVLAIASFAAPLLQSSTRARAHGGSFIAMPATAAHANADQLLTSVLGAQSPLDAGVDTLYLTASPPAAAAINPQADGGGAGIFGRVYVPSPPMTAPPPGVRARPSTAGSVVRSSGGGGAGPPGAYYSSRPAYSSRAPPPVGGSSSARGALPSRPTSAPLGSLPPDVIDLRALPMTSKRSDAGGPRVPVAEAFTERQLLAAKSIIAASRKQQQQRRGGRPHRAPPSAESSPSGGGGGGPTSWGPPVTKLTSTVSTTPSGTFAPARRPAGPAWSDQLQSELSATAESMRHAQRQLALERDMRMVALQNEVHPTSSPPPTH